MVCDRCITAVRSLLEKNNIAYTQVQLGEVELEGSLPENKKTDLQKDLKALGFELIDNRKTQLIERIKKCVLRYIAEWQDSKKVKLSSFISNELKHDYSYISDLFSSVEGSTIEQYFILQRIEKVKELLVYDQLSLSEIAYDLGFSSVHHLSAQFKKNTGLTPTYFKKLGAVKRRSIDEV